MRDLINRLFGRSPPSTSSRPMPASPAAQEPSGQSHAGEADAIAELRDKIERDVAGGFDDEDIILTTVADHFEGEMDPALVRRAAPEILRAALAEHMRAQAGWPAVTDCDRLDAAFARLEARGVIARQNFTCCMTCGSTEIWEEVQTAKEAGLPAYGYVFYHMQDTDSAVEGSGVYLAYGACDEGEAPALDVAAQIVATLEAEGLAPEWDGSWDKRIAVPLDWKRRRGVATYRS